MSFFTSEKEKRRWFYVLLVLTAIFAALFFGQPLIKIFGDQNIQAIIFVLGMLLVGAAIIIYGLKTQPRKTELVIWLGLAAVFIMLFLRLGLPERSHLFEYSILAIFIHGALLERAKNKRLIFKPALLAFLTTSTFGTLDECVQLFLPDRVFDTNDILFNGFAAFMAIGARVGLQFLRKKIDGK